jgi:ATP adenylyltransferase
VSPALAAKPQLGEKLDARFKAPETKSAPPSASDIDVTGHDIGPISETHFLAYNKFCGYRPHLMILTQDPTLKQTSDLDRADISAAWDMLKSLGSQEYVAMFNCGAAAGCSRMHKHMQLVPRPGDDFVLWPELVGWERPPISFKYYEEALTPRMSAAGVARICEDLVQQARAGEGLQGEDVDGHFAHNVLLTRDWIVVVPRRSHAYEGVTMNAVGFLGMSWGPTEDYVRRWMDVGPLNAMAGCGVPALK